jgi:type II secretory pathway pseudopilin PulG
MGKTMKRNRENDSRQRGFTLVEVLVSTAVLIIVFVGVLMVYDRGNQIFKSSNEAADMQQNLRVAYDRMLADIRMAGFDYQRGGPMMPGQTAMPWAAGRQYSAGTIVVPTPANGRTYRAVNGGISGTVQPSFPNASGASITENGATPPIVWEEVGRAVYQQPDEQIEYAGATALTVRGNFDYSANPNDTDKGRETNLESVHFPLVTTGNDEIVTYALRSTRAPKGTAPNNQSISMYIDINGSGSPSRTAHPGGNAERQVTITGIDLTNNNPPYTLYRFTFADDGSVQEIPLADNIRSLHFFYFQDAAGQKPLRNAANALVADAGGAGQYSPTVANSWNAPERQLRAKIRSIRMRLVGMNDKPDPNFKDPSVATGMYSSTDADGVPVFTTDTIAQEYRRVVADTLVSPRNLGLTGLPQTFLQPPPAPTITSVCTGYCAITVVNWTPNTNNPNASYVVLWDTVANGSFSNASDAGTSNTFAVDLTSQDVSGNFYFKVRATNAGGSTESAVYGPVLAKNATTPNPPSSLVATTGATALPGKVRLTWTAPVTNAAGTVTCSPTGTPSVTTFLREIRGFRIYKSTNANVPMNPSTLEVDETTADEEAPVTDGYGNFAWEDVEAACGVEYFYKVVAVEWCEASNAYNTTNNNNIASSEAAGNGNTTQGVSGSAGTSGTPAAPVNLRTSPLAPAEPAEDMENSACTSTTCDIRIAWSKVTQDTLGNTLAIDKYEVERTQLDNTGIPTGQVHTFTIEGTSLMPGSTVYHTDLAVPKANPLTTVDYKYRYRVRAIQDTGCPNGAFGLYADYPPPCTFTGSVVVQSGASSGDGLTPQTAWIMNAGDTIQVMPPLGTTFTSTTMRLVDSGGTVTDEDTVVTSPANFTWGTGLTAGATYTVTFTMTNNAIPPCTEQIVRYVQQEPLPACALTTFDEASSTLANTATQYQMRLNLKNEGNEALTLTALRFNWTRPDRIEWQTIKFPSSASATVTGPGTATGNYNVTLSPKPALLSTSDVTVNPGTTQSVLLNMARTNGNPPNITPSIVNSICVQYTLVSQPGFTFSCRIKPNASDENPDACQ